MTSTGLMTYRPQIKVVDATIRDGGLCNNFFFEDQFILDLYHTALEAGIDYIEMGYKADKDLFDESTFGKWKFCHEDDILSVLGDEISPRLKIACMADVGRCNYQRDIGEKADSPISLYRIATYINTMPTAIAMAEHCKKLGYEATVNIMAISKAREADVTVALDMLGNSAVDGFYIVDSYGSMYPEEIRALAEKYLETANKYGKFVGIHAHNNQQLAFANTIEATAAGVNYLDATMSAMGRGAGNCAMELLLGFLKNPKYNVVPVLKFIETEMTKLREQGVKWGYDVQYALTGRLNRHPSSAIEFTKKDRRDFSTFYRELLEME